MDLTFPLCENSEALSSPLSIQEQYTLVQAKVLAVPLRPPDVVFNLRLAYFGLQSATHASAFFFFFFPQKNKNKDDYVMLKDLKIKMAAEQQEAEELLKKYKEDEARLLLQRGWR